ncbi:uncharacterized protein Z520_11823 [Fonsecaea multimorphosa CBS 102226]|uniref:DUF7907 domain-containing protein n=1 Tax=Fonsecaea multimorphosa CBS 102226 TaxID=1442371 RepID=A0A0D2K873_9EURO|nr:uncharacterized protein Z520_11823 [Fonsecaea multimorphosa CBS 102226]KIX92503.1 hypothetical protein Z520_11823 [Fonsecaea multimorphosa CBS 102226]OAL19616.1 hypothetical protein AYO22_09778 [Fonsecaea multimorphosa]
MLFSTLLTVTLLSIFNLTSASPLQTRNTIDPPALYLLQTKVVKSTHKDYGTNKTDLWLYSYHTGAGLGDAALSSNKSWAWQGYLNGSQQLMTYSGNLGGPWPLAIGYGPYQEWNEVTISIAGITSLYSGFFFNSSGLQFNASLAIGGTVFPSSSKPMGTPTDPFQTPAPELNFSQ